MEMTVGYARKIKPGTATYDFENEEASVYFKTEVGDEITDYNDLAEWAQQLFAVAKVRVLTELGLPFQSSPEGLVVETERAIANVVKQFPGTTVVQEVKPARPAPPVQVAPAAPVAAPPMVAPAAAPIVGTSIRQFSKTELVSMYLEDPSQWWDNRDRATGNQPIFRHKTLKYTDKNGKEWSHSLWAKDFAEAGVQI